MHLCICSLIGMADCYAPEEDTKANGSGATGGAGGSGRFVTFAPGKPQPLQSGFSSMKRGIHSFMSTMDAALKHTSQANPGNP